MLANFRSGGRKIEKREFGKKLKTATTRAFPAVSMRFSAVATESDPCCSAFGGSLYFALRADVFFSSNRMRPSSARLCYLNSGLR